MDIAALIRRSKSRERIDFASIGCENDADPLVALDGSGGLRLEPIWSVPFEDHEGKLYQDYIGEHPAYNQIYVRQSVKDRLHGAAATLPDTLHFVVRAGHRPISVQKRLLSELQAFYLDENPAATPTEALEHARTFVSDPDVRLPAHCCGAAVDVDIFDTTAGKHLDFGALVNTDSEISYLHTDLINEKQRQNRLVLLSAMLSAGFASNPFEWWHYSYGDQNWAWFYHKNKSLYGIIEPEL